METIESVRKRLLGFLDLNNLKKVAIISDNDEDGITSAVQTKQFFDKYKITSKIFFYDHAKKQMSFSKKVFMEFDAQKTIFLDLSENFIFDILEIVGDFVKSFVIIDHHQGVEVVNGKYPFLVIKPNQFSNEDMSKYPVSKMVYDLLEGNAILASVGIIGDFSQKVWADFIKKNTKGKITFKDIEEIAKIIACISSIHSKKIDSLSAFLLNHSPEKLLKSDFAKLSKNFYVMLNDEQELFEKKAIKDEKHEFYFFESKKNLQSKLSNLISQRYPNKTIFVYAVEDNFIKGSMRRQDFKFDCNKATRFALESVENATGGGHIPATGCRFPKEFFGEFRKRLIKFQERNID